MNKIREGIARYLTKQFIWSEPDEMPEDECYTEADYIPSYLHSQGIVRKAKCPYCAWSQFDSASMTPCSNCNSTGYTIEPLI